MQHRFGIVIFVPMGTDQGFPKAVSVGAHDVDDPFCYHCGQKWINAKDTECPGQEDNFSRNVLLRDLNA